MPPKPSVSDRASAAAGRYVYAFEFVRRRIAENMEPTDSPEAAHRLLRPLFDGAESERVVVAALDRKNRPIGIETLYLGTAASSPVRIAELFRTAIRLNASAILMAHNHPSGDVQPSADDLRTTEEASAAGELLGLPLIDHLIIGEGSRFVSLRHSIE